MTHTIGRKALLALVLVLAGAPVMAQTDPGAEARIRKLEAEVRALQGKVFPGGDGKFFAAQVQPAAPGAAPAGGTPATTPVTDLLTRMDAVEAALARITAASEANGNRLTQLETKLAASAAAPAVGATTEGNLAAMTGGASAPKPAAATPTPTPAAATPKPAAKPAAPSAQRLAAVRAVEKPQTADPADDEYSYGFRLWEAKLYPESEQQLKLYLDKYPRHSRVSFARNLMGRALLDEGKPLDAAKWFFENHQADPKGARAPDSLLFLAEAMKRNKDTKRACVALAQFADDYPAEAAARLKAQYDVTRSGLTCN
ncbi:MAG: tetratricopeptide repeat protein [Novosphingobium sp.]